MELLYTAHVPPGEGPFPTIVALHGWGAKHVYGEADSGVAMIHKTCGHDLAPRIACGHCNEIVKPRDIEVKWAMDCPTVGDMMPRERTGEEVA